MASTDFTIKVRVDGATDIAQVQKALASLGATVVRTNTSTKEGTKGAKDFYDTQAKGIIGIGNSTKSFSKLAETIGRGNSSGLVGAYATLAANTFAVVAAFNALRGASQVEQVFKGLEAAGIRTGRSLTTTAMALKEVTGNAVSTEQALRSTAQITSAGFDGKAVERLGKAARDTSFALGRNLTDSLDRLSRGVVKLEPELLDELGIMTKLGESSSKYAATLGKNETQLSNFEKRTGFLNAVLAEAELKFGGLSAAAGDSTAYDKLASKFVDLSNSIFNAFNLIAKPIAGVLASSSTLLLGVFTLFGASLKNQLIPSLAGSAAAANAAAAASAKLAAAEEGNIATARALALEENKKAIAQKSNFDYLGKTGPKVYRDLREAIKDGTAEAGAQERAVKSLNQSINRNIGLLQEHLKYQGVDNPARLAKLAELEALDRERTELIALGQARSKTATDDVEHSQQVIKARNTASVAASKAAAAEASAASIGAASQFKLGVAWTELKASVVSYSAAQKLAAAEGSTSLAVLRTSAFAAATGVKVLGTAFLTALPYIGLIVVGIGLIQSAIDALTPESIKKLNKAFEQLIETVDKANDFSKELERISLSTADGSQRVAAALTIQSNAIREATTRYQDYINAQEEASKTSFLDILSGNIDQQGVASFWETFGEKNFLSYQLGLKRNAASLDIAEVLNNSLYSNNLSLNDNQKAAIKQYNLLEQTAPKALAKAIEARGGFDKFKQSLVNISDDKLSSAMLKLSQEVNKGLSSVADDIKTAQDALKELDLGIGAFARASVQSTGYDSVVKNFDSVTDAIERLQKNLDPTNLTQFLTGLGDSTKRVLSVDTGKQLSEYLKADAEVQKQVNLQKDKSANFDVDALANAKRKLDLNSNLGSIIAREVGERSKLFRQAQEEERTLKSQVTLENARLASNSKLYSMGGAGRAAQIKDEERIRGIQVQILQTQINVQKSLIVQNEAAINKLDTEKLTNQLYVARYTIFTKLYEMAAKQALVDAANAKGIALNVADIESGAQSYKDVAQSLQAQVQTYLAAQRATKEVSTAEERILEINKEKELKQRSIRDSLDTIKELSNQIATINSANLTVDQKRASIIEAQTALNAETLSNIESVIKKNQELRGIYDDMYGRINGINDRLDYQLAVNSRNADSERSSLRRAYEDRKQTLENVKRTAEAELTRKGLSEDLVSAAKSGVQAAENNLFVAEQQLNTDLAIVDANEQKVILEKTLFDTRSQGLDYQKQALDILTKQVDVARSLSDEAQKTSELQAKLVAKRRGYELSDLGNQALEIQGAQRAYELAVQESEIKKSLIDLEFALLDAQKSNLLLELQTKKASLSSLNEGGRFDAQIAQIDATVSNLSKIDLNSVAANQKRLIDENIKNLKLSLETTLIPAFQSPFGKQMSAIKGLADFLASRRAAKNANPTPIVVSAASIDKSPQKTSAEIKAALEASNPVLSANTRALEALTAEIRKMTTTSPTSTVNGSQFYGTARQRTLDAADYAKSQGATVTELQGRGRVGTHVNGSQHYVGQAFDVNMAPGMGEINNPVIAAKMDKLAADLRAMGATVLWRVSGHWDHMHVQYTQALEESVKKVTQSATKAIASNDNTAVITSEKKRLNGLPTSTTHAQEVADTSMSRNFEDKNDPITGSIPKIPSGWTDEARAGVQAFLGATEELAASLAQLGPEGEIVVALRNGMASIVQSTTVAVDTFSNSGSSFKDKFIAVAEVASSALATVQSALAASANARMAAVDKEIAAEQKKDGKSADSVAKIKSLEKQKDEIGRKSFETNKKLQLAQAVISTASGVAAALAIPFIGIPLAAAIAAMGLAQIAIISGTSYQSTASTSGGTITPPSLTIGKRGDSVDLAKSNTNVGGELGYLRGTQGYGNNASNYSVIGSAYGGPLPRGYGRTAYVVGEKGPETIDVGAPMSVRPSNDNSGNAPVHASFTIQALDSAGVEQILTEQKGNIIGMLREAANANGKPFMENVNVNVYNRPNKGTRL